MDIKDEDGVPRNPQILKRQALSTLCHGACILAFFVVSQEATKARWRFCDKARCTA